MYADYSLMEHTTLFDIYFTGNVVSISVEKAPLMLTTTRSHKNSAYYKSNSIKREFVFVLFDFSKNERSNNLCNKLTNSAFLKTEL